MTEPTRPADRPTDPAADTSRSDESRDISDVGLPGPGDDTATPDAATPDTEADEAALDEVFPPAG